MDVEEAEARKKKQGNTLQTWGNATTMNINSMIYTNILSSPYFKNSLFKLKTYHEVVDEIYYKVDHMEPWEKGSRKTSGQVGMCGGVRGVGAGGIVSSCYCLLFKMFTLKMTRKQLKGLLDHPDSPYIRGIGFMYIRYCLQPRDIWSWVEPYLEDEEEIDVKAGSGCIMTIGQMVRSFLLKLEWYGTLFPRIPVPVEKDIRERLTNINLCDDHKRKADEGWGEAEKYARDQREGSTNLNSNQEDGFGEAEKYARMRRITTGSADSTSKRNDTRDRSRERPVARSRRDGSWEQSEKRRNRDRSREGTARRSSRERSRDRSERRNRERSRERSERRRSRERSRERQKRRSRDRSRDRSERRYRERSRERPKRRSRDRSREKPNRRKSRDRSKERSDMKKSRDISKDRYYEMNSRRDRSKDRDKKESRSRDHSKSKPDEVIRERSPREQARDHDSNDQAEDSEGHNSRERTEKRSGSIGLDKDDRTDKNDTFDENGNSKERSWYRSKDAKTDYKRRNEHHSSDIEEEHDRVAQLDESENAEQNFHDSGSALEQPKEKSKKKKEKKRKKKSKKKHKQQTNEEETEEE